ncbi:MAG: ATP-binding cassette subfamily B protein [Phenylobacterium sp.]|jgi:ATP-binding cassette subfamily B protein
MFKKPFKVIRQLDVMDCGPTCIMMIGAFYGKNYSLNHLRQLCDKGQQGVSLLGINRAAEELGFKTLPLKLNVETFINQAKLPCIVHWQGDHYVVVHKISKGKVSIADPGTGKATMTVAQFSEFWTQGNESGIALFVEPTEKFYQQEQEHQQPQSKNGLKRLLNHLFRFKKFLAQLGLGALLGSVLNLIFPFLTQALVDHGIGNRDINFVYAILIAQLMLFFSRTATEFIRGWILVHMGTRINIAVISEFLMKLMRLPLSYFNSRNLGDVLQRVSDHDKIEEFLTSHSINIVFALLNLVIFSIIMAIYSTAIFMVFFFGSIASIGWVMLFLNRRRVLDYQHFSQMRANQNTILQLVNGMPEIKMNQAEASQRWAWEGIQAKLFNVRLKSLALEQYQQAGTLFFNEGKNIIITFMAANLVISGELTLGMMMAITYILGQMNAPIEQLLQFIRQAQDAKLSMERLGEIQDMREEKDELGVELSETVPQGNIDLDDVCFKYSRHDKGNVIDHLSLSIPYQKTTAIVGSSGSGKTTLVKLLLKFFPLDNGRISINDQDLNFVDPDAWRSKCGVVMQDGYIFNDTIGKNIAVGNHKIDFERVAMAAKSANIHAEIERLPQGYHTKIGQEGIGLSGGQTQRVLIARAIYKNPDFLFFDEATSALDANNEKIIQQNLQQFYKGKTVVVVAHRLSTVKNADQIIVLDQGQIVEQGNHQQLTEKKGFYYELVKNQLELGA